jgi:hypothetical protein
MFGLLMQRQAHHLSDQPGSWLPSDGVENDFRSFGCISWLTSFYPILLHCINDKGSWGSFIWIGNWNYV